MPLASAATISGLGDGVTQVAGALLALSLTRRPLRLAGLLAAQQLPWALGALPAGALVDRVDRRRAMAAACLARAAALGTLGLLTAAGRAGLPLLYAVLLLVGGAGVVYENAATAVPPGPGWPGAADPGQRAAAGRDVAVAQPGRPAAGRVAVHRGGVGPVPDRHGRPAAGHVPDRGPPSLSPRPAPPGVPRGTWRASMGEGLAWLAGHRPLRALALAAALSNLGLGALFSVFALFARVRLGTGPLGYGVLLAVIAAGGLLGGLAAGWVISAVGAGPALRMELVVEALSYVGLLLTRARWRRPCCWPSWPRT